MKKKLAAVMLAAAMTLPTAAFAAELDGILTENGIAIITEDKTRLILNGYDENGMLVSSGMFEAKDGAFIVPAKLAQRTLRATFLDGEIYDVNVTTGDITPTDAPAATEAPEVTASPKPTDAPANKYPAVYDKQIDAIDAIAVVNKVSQGQNENLEPYYYVDALYQGSEIRLDIEAEVTVTSASDEFDYMLGQNMGALKKGDVICFTANLSGKIKNVGFVYRPVADAATNGKDYGSSFERLISNNGKIAERSDWGVMTYGGGNRTRSALAFGVVRERTANSVTLLGPDGNESKAVNVSLKKDTIVYVCDMSVRNELSIDGIGGIEKSGIPRSAEDEKGNVTYDVEQDLNYALLRVVDGTVTDAVIYTNYN